MLTGAAAAQVTDLQALTADDLLFSVENMDLSADPRKDFYRFAAGGWLDRVARPEDKPSLTFVSVQLDRIRAQVKAVLEKAVAESATAPKGSATQLVGDFYKSYVDIERRNAQGMAPLREELDRIAAMANLDDLAREAGHLMRIGGISPLILIGPQPDLADNTKYAIYAGAGAFGLETERDVYSSGEDAPRRIAYRTFVNDLLKAAGYDADAADRMTGTILEIETALDKAKLNDADKRDWTKLYNPMTLDELQAQVPNLSIAAYLDEVGLDAPERIILVEPNYFPALSKMLAERSLQDFKDFASYLLIQRFSGVLSTDMEEPDRALKKAFQGVAPHDPPERQAARLIQAVMGQPLSQLYVEATYDESTTTSVTEMIEQVLAEFRKRIPTRDWLAEETKAEALAKLDAFYFAVGHPDKWIDYSGVDIVPDNPVSNLMALVEFDTARTFSKLGGPVEMEHFNGRSTLPVALNAAYTVTLNGFEVTAAIAQPPAYQPDADPAVRYCRFGAILGHEATHGFDTSGSQFDAKGNLRNWWTEADRAAFLVEAKKLVEQVNETDIVEGYHGNGVLWLPENMADVGGITLAHQALMQYLAQHPDEDVEIDGISQERRCFIAWAQLWAEKATDEYLINVATSENHPPNTYRTTAPLQHVDAFYDAFGIKEGDPMWLEPEKRVHAW